MRALLVRMSAIGDVVHTLPVLAALRGQGAEVDWLVEPAALSLLEGNPALRRVVVAPPARRFAPGAASRAWSAVRGGGYDAALDLQGLWKSAAWARASGAPRVIGFAAPWRREGSSQVLLRERATLSPAPAHVIDQNLALLRALGIDAVGAREFPLPAAPDTEAVARARAVAGGPELVILDPGGGWASKLWPAESFGALARLLADGGLHPVVVWGPGEDGLAARVASASSGAAAVAPATSLLDLVALARHARLMVAADTGPLHLACAVRTPVVGVFGPTDPARNGPFDPADVVVRRVPPCAPCHRRRCARHEGIMATIDPSEIAAAAFRRLQTPAASPSALPAARA